MKLFCSSGVFHGASSVSEVLESARRAGIFSIELASGLHASPADLERLSELAQSESEWEFLVHNYFPAPEEPMVLNLAAEDPEERAHSLQFCRGAMQISADLAAPFFSVHGGFVSNLKTSDLGRPERQRSKVTREEREEAMVRFQASVSSLLEEAESLGIDLYLENNVDGVHGREPGAESHLLLVEAEETVMFFEDMNHPRLGLLLDTGHLYVSAHSHGFDPVGALHKMSPWIKALHLSDNDGSADSNEKCVEGSWFWEALKRRTSLGSLHVVLEAYRLESAEVQEQLALIEKKFPAVHA